MQNTDDHILTTPVDELHVNPALISFMKRHGIPTLEKLLDYGVPDLQGMEGFDEIVLRSLMDILKSAGAIHRLNQWPKKR